MFRKIQRHFLFIKGTIFHPQWLSDRNHLTIKKRIYGLDKQKILDVGSGNSEHSPEFLKNNFVVQLDYPKTNAYYIQSPQVFGDACHLPFPDSTFDAVLLLEVLEHIPSDTLVLKEILRVLRPGGTLYLSTPFLYPVHDAPIDYRRYTAYGIEAILKEAGFKKSLCKAQGNQFTSALLLLIMSNLHAIKNVTEFNKFVALFCIPLAYGSCLVINLLAIVFLPLKSNKHMCTGYFTIANKTENYSK